MKKLLFHIMLLSILGFIQLDTHAQTASKYVCPMHADVVSDKPGNCSKCGMPLEKISVKVQESETSALKPVFAKTVDGYGVKVWIEPLKTIVEKKTHHVEVQVTEKKTKKIMNDCEVWFHIVYPSKRNLMPRLTLRNSVFSDNVDLGEKGKYKLMVHLTVGDKHPACTFKYEIR